ncbi:MAG: phosphatidate cytidylyltransferase [Myxococcota bacterium]
MSEGTPVSDPEVFQPQSTSEPRLAATPDEAPAAKSKKHSELVRRMITAAVLVPAAIYIIITGGLLILATVVVIIVLGQREFYRLIEDKGVQPLVGLGLVAGAALPVVAYLGNEYHATLLMTASLLALMVAQLGKAEITEALASISGTFFGVFYVGWLLSHTVVLRRFHDAALAKYGAEDLLFLGLTAGAGIFFLIYTLTVVVGCDAGAYFAGRAYGRRKLAPKISPGKTVEGALGGVLAGIAAGLVVKGIFDLFWPSLSSAFPWSLVIPFAVVLSCVGVIGDLVESLLKRDAKVKDTGALLPGMGGVLDRIDSPLLAIPVMYYMLLGYFYLRIG